MHPVRVGDIKGGGHQVTYFVRHADAIIMIRHAMPARHLARGKWPL